MIVYNVTVNIDHDAHGSWVEWMKEVLERRIRRTGGVTAHPFGLYLVQVEYRDEFELPERYIGPHFLTGFAELDG